MPKQISTGDRTILGKIYRRGNRYLRALFVQAAWVVLVRGKCWKRYGLKSWIEAAKKRLHHNVLAIVLANKLARIAWAVLHKGGCLRVRQASGDGVPSCLILAPCSGPSRRSLAAAEQDARTARRPALTALCARRACARRPGRRNDRQARTKERREVRRDR